MSTSAPRSNVDDGTSIMLMRHLLLDYLCLSNLTYLQLTQTEYSGLLPDPPSPGSLVIMLLGASPGVVTALLVIVVSVSMQNPLISREYLLLLCFLRLGRHFVEAHP